MTNKVTTIFENDTKAAVRSLGDLIDKSEGAETAGKQLARQISAMADSIDEDFHQSAAAADALGAALGPELAARVGRNGIDQMVGDLQKAGLTSDQIVTDVNELAASITRLDQVGASLDGPNKGLQNVRKDLGDVGDASHRVGVETDQTRSVMANFTGNAIQELPGVGSAMGPLNMAIGQFGEYSAEGNINFKKMLTAGAGMFAVTIALKAVTGELAKQKEINAFEKKKVEDWTKAIIAGKDSVEALVDAAREAGEIKTFVPFEGIKDITPSLAALGVTAEQFFTMVKGGAGPAQAWVKSMRDAGVSGKDLDAVTFALVGELEAQGKATEGAAEFNKVYAAGVDDVTSAVKDSTTTAAGYSYAQADVQRATEAATRATDDATRKSDAHATSLQNQRDKLDGLYASERSAVDSKFAYREATALADADVAKLNETLSKHKVNEDDARAATDAAKDSVLRASEGYATLNGAAIDSDAGVRRQIDSLTLQASTLKPGSELRLFLDEYIAALAAIPSNISTIMDLHISSGSATTAAGDVIGKRTGKSASGTSFTSEGTYTVGESGPEEIDLPSGARIWHAGDTANRQQGVTYIDRSQTINHLPPGIDTLSLLDSQRRLARQGFRA